MSTNMTLDEKLAKLQHLIKEMGSLVIGFSGGVDSTFLVKVAYDILGNRVLAVIATSATYPEREYKQAIQLATEIGVKYKVITSEEMDIPGFRDNSPQRCYFCKKELFSKLKKIAEEEHISHVADGSNLDDLSDFRAGLKALKELGIRSPLQEAALTKNEIRELSRRLHLPTWDKPAMACLSSRFPYGVKIDRPQLQMVNKAEDFLHESGIKTLRVRHYGDTARIEVGKDDFPRFLDPEFREKVVRQLKNIGYVYITLDLEGYRTGSMNEVLGEELRASYVLGDVPEKPHNAKRAMQDIHLLKLNTDRDR